jgi:phosphoenolpyruvate-protein kinase (PTS system EI component)
MVVDAGRNTGTEVSVCGELAANPLGVFMLIGMGVEILSVGTSALAEVRKVIRSTDSRNAARAVQVALRAFTPDEVLDALTAGFRQGTDVSIFGGTLGLPVAD